MTQSRRTSGTGPGILSRMLAGVGLASLLVGGGWFALDAANAAEAPVSEATFSWRVNDEAGGGSFFGGCNFLVAGEAGNSGGSRLWTEADGFYATEAGDVTITKPDASGAQTKPTWATKCLDRNGATVSAEAGSTTETQVNFTGGTGTVDAATNSGTIRWEGAFTIVFYGGLTYWSMTDPVLTVSNGAGTLTAVASGYGADRDNPEKWVPLDRATIELATFSGVELTETGAIISPDYAGVSVETGSAAAQKRDGEHWGAFPQSFVDFNMLTGQSGFWYSTGGQVDAKKPAAPITVGYQQTEGAYAALEHARYPQGYDRGLEVAFGGLEPAGDGASSRIELRDASGATLPTVDAAVLPADDGTALGRWDIEVLQPGTYSFDAYLVQDGDASGGDDSATKIALASPITFEVVAPLGSVAPELQPLTATSSTVKATWAWPNVAAGPPTDYRVSIVAGTSAAGAPVDERIVTTPEHTFIGLAPETDYTVEVAPRIAGIEGTPSQQTVRTPAAADGGGGDGGGSQEPTPDPTTGPDPDGGATGDTATFYWGLSKEANSVAYFGGCNFLSAGRAGDKGSATPWSEGDGLYASSSGNVTIIKPVGESFEQASWSTKCLDRNGATVSQAQGSYSEAQVRITGGEVAKHADGSMSIQWRGSFTVVFYGGLTYWSANDPRLEIDATGNGKVTATASGYGASMQDSSKWTALDERTITLATLSGLTAEAVERNDGFAQAPDYLGVAYSGTGASQEVVGSGGGTATGQVERTALNAAYWGSFPSDFVDFQKETGQFSYWFTSGGARDAYKPATTMTVSLNGSGAPTVGSYNAAPAPSLNQQQPGGGGAGGGSTAGGGGAGGGATDDASGGGAATTTAGAATELATTGGERGPIHPALLVGGGAGLLAIAAANWAIGLFVRRRLGLDPAAYA